MTEIPDSNATAELRREEARVEARSGVFKKERGLTDLVFTQILFIIGLPWIGVAAKQAFTSLTDFLPRHEDSQAGSPLTWQVS